MHLVDWCQSRLKWAKGYVNMITLAEDPETDTLTNSVDLYQT